MTDFETFPDRGATRFVRSRSLGDVVSVTLRFLIRHAKPLIVGQLTIAGPALVLFVAAQALTGTGEVFVPDDPFAIDGDEMLSRFGSTLLLPYLALLVFSVVSYGVAFGYVRAYREGRADGDGPLWDDVGPVLWPITSVTLLSMLMWVVLGGVASLLIIGMLGVALGAMGGVVGVVGVVALFAYIVPAWTVSYPARLFDTDRSGDALVRGFKLVRGRWWMSFGTLLVILLVGGVLSVVAVLPAGILDATREAAGQPATAWTRAVFSAFNMVGSMLLATLVAVASAFLHGSLSAEADDLDMMDDLSRLEADPDTTPAPPLTDDGGNDRWAPTADAPPSESAPSADAAPLADAAPETAPETTPDADGGFRGGGFRGGGFGS